MVDMIPNMIVKMNMMIEIISNEKVKGMSTRLYTSSKGNMIIDKSICSS
jgi:hypothetical protein